MLLKNKVAIITGSRRGIGYGIAEEFAKQGANIIISDINQKDCEKAAAAIAKKYKVKAVGVECDVSDGAQVKDLIYAGIKKFKRIDILVNNAGIFESFPLDKYSDESWDKLININLKGVFLCTREASKQMVKQKSGKIISIASIAGLVGYANSAAYCAAKAGIINMTREFALELAPEGINVNAIAPGAIDTPMTSFMKKNPALLKQTLAIIPKGRMGLPKDIGMAAVFLASDMADYVTGHTLVVDGGWISQ